MKRLNLESRKIPDWTDWKNAVSSLVNPSNEISIGIVGKYLSTGDYQLVDSYISINESLKHSSAKNNTRINIKWINAQDLEKNDNLKEVLNEVKGIIIPGGFGSAGVEGKIKTIKYCRENNIPFLGLCYGLQLAVIEYARNVCGLKEANTTEVNSSTPHPIIDIMPEQKNINNKGGTMRLGAYKAILQDKSKVKELYGNINEVSERHRHRYEVNPLYHSILKEKGMILSGMSVDERLVEFIELPNLKFFIATQSHPEFKSYLLHPAPLFDGFVKACLI